MQYELNIKQHIGITMLWMILLNILIKLHKVSIRLAVLGKCWVILRKNMGLLIGISLSEKL